ncbi:GNAT family N-acetyltransferase [Pseudoalteromonas luteoviolacea]|uniref:N-acetyltransferase domain-containing protein n=1 Tax=Pseudoalteromonas luteoviolacea S4054 TaxID=1129367 RepID=A0A0F6A5L0_9GAMM|nr:GNAT family N-acetyltransferase [Pseudoalteromonas luteoviolacea]AOT10519.1 hypothetical protein S4054249_21885 [Pseudoalteromonas luteoviolacea]AOT15413.1 hypothetical protein S40542_21710 [Pseudoalteromonas luteoviolacea]AOT20338.1 hypothetical protein S4054_21800 [Pseudoalteromonas luteoviolacea]KKE81470.1 hypothetical protein N479_03020 [Pseudoalteromonas luteoviolacea S4054]KZN71633.1 hypothetical protein N481_18360 [Pseudoalteromonas luteoviolacea S4047-1]
MLEDVIAVTLRCRVRKATINDVSFIIQLLNQQSFIKNIGDKRVKDEPSAKEYIKQAFLMQYELERCAPYIVCLTSGEAIGIAGFYQRSYLQNPDLGYAFIDEYTGKGYAKEVCQQLLIVAHQHFKLTQLHAVTDINNISSKKLLNKLGFKQVGKIHVQSTDKADCLFTYDLD